MAGTRKEKGGGVQCLSDDDEVEGENENEN